MADNEDRAELAGLVFKDQGEPLEAGGIKGELDVLADARRYELLQRQRGCDARLAPLAAGRSPARF
ncbi:hypothetical protein ACU8MT_15565 [Rhizobium leguminosarum]